MIFICDPFRRTYVRQTDVVRIRSAPCRAAEPGGEEQERSGKGERPDGQQGGERDAGAEQGKGDPGG